MSRYLAAGLFILGLAVFVFALTYKKDTLFQSPVGKIVPPKTLLKYTFVNLHNRSPQPSEIIFDREISDTNGLAVWVFHFTSLGKKISGEANLPAKVSTQNALAKPTVIMAHGYVEPKDYHVGMGTERVAAELAKSGFVTLAPDFAGYGESDKASPDAFEDRFQTYTTMLDLISSVEQDCKLKIDADLIGAGDCKLALWGHSNGGQIALSTLEISGQNLPTVLWNPVSKPFPYSILYYTDTFDDKGKNLRKALADFESNYDVENYSTPNFYSWITGPVFIAQGGADESVPPKWSEELLADLKAATKEARLKMYPGADHNLMPSWNQAVADTINFYKEKL